VINKTFEEDTGTALHRVLKFIPAWALNWSGGCRFRHSATDSRRERWSRFGQTISIHIETPASAAILGGVAITKHVATLICGLWAVHDIATVAFAGELNTSEKKAFIVAT
jgi:hypothetical protein